MATRRALSANIPCLTTLAVLAAVLLFASLQPTADGISEELIVRLEQEARKKQQQENERNANFDEKDLGITTLNLIVEYSPLSKKDNVAQDSTVSCLNRRISDDEGEVHVVGFKPESSDDNVDKIVLYGCPQLATGLSVKTCVDGCLGPSVIMYEWERGRCPDYPAKSEAISVGGPLLIHELVLEVQHKKGADLSSGLSLKIIPESNVRSDNTVEKLIAYYESQPGYEPCDEQRIKEVVAAADDTGPENVLIPEEAYEGDYRFVRAYPGPAEGALDTNALEPEEWWPREALGMGQVAGVATDQHGLVYAFQRGERRWLQSDFDSNHVFRKRKRAIQDDVVLMMDPHSGYVLDSWGAGRFFMPHGITIDHEGNMWLTDVALHQVFKYPADIRARMKPSLVLGRRFQPGSDWKHFCQPTDVAVDSKTGNFFVADGYCNSRVLKFAPNGSVLMEITAPSNPDQPEELRTFDIPHSLALAEKRQLLCVADREHGRILCFNSTTGEYDRQIASDDFGGRVFAIAYDAEQDVLYAVNGPTDDEYYPTRGFTIDLDSGRILSTWNRPTSDLEQFVEPHDLAVYSGAVYVADVGAERVWKFWDEATPSNEVWQHRPWKN